MKVTRDVIVDLWPLYEADAASPDSRALVEEFLMSDPGLAQSLKQGEEAARRLLAPQGLRPPDDEKAALDRVKLLLRLRYYMLALAISTTALAALLRAYRPFTIFLALLSMSVWALLWLNVGSHDLETGAPPDARRGALHQRYVLLALAVVAGLFGSMMRPLFFRVPLLGVAAIATVYWLVLVFRTPRP